VRTAAAPTAAARREMCMMTCFLGFLMAGRDQFAAVPTAR
jgi:hypothetical protein